MTTKTTPRPTIKAGENDKTFRLRALEWLLRENPDGLETDAMVIQFYKEFPTLTPSKETVVRGLKILCERQVAQAYASAEDGRRTVWAIK